MWLSSRRLNRAAIWAPALALLAGTAPATAAEWQLNPKIELGYLYDDNYRLNLPENANEVSGGVLDAQLEFRNEGQLTTFSFVPRVHSTYFPDDSDEDSNDYFGRLDLQRQGERFELGVRADYSQQTIASSEQPDSNIDSGLGETGGADAGIAVVNNRRDLARLRPTYEYELATRHRLEVNADLLDVGYDEQIPGAQVDYQNLGGSLGYAFELSPRSTLTVRGLASRYDVELEANSADAYGLEAEWSTRSERLTQGYLRAGVQQTQFEADPLTGADGETDTGYLAGAGLRWNFQLTELFVDGTHSVGPTGSGFVVERDQLRLRMTRLFSPRFSMFTGVRGTQDRAVKSDALYPTRQYASGDLGLEWRVMQQLAIVAAVDYTWQQFEGITEDATSSGATLSFIYEPRRPE